MTEANGKLLMLSIGDVLIGDERVGVHLVHHLEKECIPNMVELLDGGTGSFLSTCNGIWGDLSLPMA